MTKSFYTNVAVRGDNVLYRGYENGQAIQKKIPYSPTIFLPTQKETDWKTLDGVPVEPFNAGSMSETKKFIDQYKGVKGFEIHGVTDPVFHFIGDEFPDEVDFDFNTLKIANIDIETTAEDGFPQVDNPREQIIAITVDFDGDVHVFGLGDFHIAGVTCYSFETEIELLQSFLSVWDDKRPDIVTGWNIRFFDIPYLVSRIKAIMPDAVKFMSPWRVIRDKTILKMNQEREVYELLGISTLDYYELYTTFTYVTQESYRLDHIAFVELGERKLDYGEYDTIVDFYKGDFQRFMEYNVRDVQLVRKLEDKLKLLELATTLAYSAKVNFMDIFSQVKTWDQIIYHYLKKQKIAIPSKNYIKKDSQYAGAYVKEPIVGKHDWIVSFDLNSLYPHLIMQYNISPETLIDMSEDSRFGIGPNNILAGPDDLYGKTCYGRLEKLKSKDYSVAANGTCYTKDVQGFLPALMEKMYKDRKMFKKKMIECQKQRQEVQHMNMSTIGKAGLAQKLDYDIAKYNNFQLVRKIQLNSAYGAIGNEWFRYYDVRMAEAITLSGQLSIRWIADKLNAFLNETLKTGDYDYVVASDTDSVYLRLEPLVNQTCKGKTTKEIVAYLNKASEKIILPFIEKKYEELAELMNAYQNKMVMEREVIADTGVWTAKKRYMLNVHNSEGVEYEEPKLKIMGIETTRSSTPQFVRDRLKKAIELILTKDEDSVIRFIDEVKAEFNQQNPEDIAFPRGVSNLSKYRDSTHIYKKATPIAVKGALIYNHYVRKLGLQKKYATIQEGEKIKFLYLKSPNPVGGVSGKDQVISFQNTLPKEFDLLNYIDYDRQFDVSFLEPLKSILDAIGWKHKEVATLESLFS
jgi:DNA polymerase elongation subunit (family B)